MYSIYLFKYLKKIISRISWDFSYDKHLTHDSLAHLRR